MPEMSPAPAPQPTETQPLPMNATPDQFGAGVFGEIAQGAAQINAGLEQRREIDMKNAVDAQAGAAQVALAQFQARMSDVENAAKGDSRIPANTYQAAILGRFDQDSPALLSGIDNPIVARMVKNQLGEMRARFAQSSGDYQTVSLARLANANTLAADNANDTLAGTVLALGDLRMIQNRSADLWHHQPDLTNEQRTMGTIQSAQKQALSYAWGWAQRDGAEAIKRIDNGEFTEAGVPAEQLHVLRSAAMAQVAQVKAQERQNIAFQKAASVQQVDLWKGQQRQGEDVDPKAVLAEAQKLDVLGDPVKAREARELVDNQKFMRMYRAMVPSPVDLQQHVSALAAKKNPTQDEQHELAWFRANGNGLVEKFRADPIGYLSAWGAPGTQPPSVNFSDPQTLKAREAWWGAAAKTSGNPGMHMFSETELAGPRQMLAQGGADRAAIVNALDAMSDNGRALAVRQIAPDDYTFQHQVMLVPEARAMLQYGREAQKGNPSYFPRVNDAMAPQQGQYIADAMSRVDFAWRMLDPKEAQAIKQNMMDILAGQLSRKGKSNGYEITENDLRQALAYAMGGQIKNGRQYGGIAQWGGAGGAYFVVPENMNTDDFRNAWSADYFRQKKAGHGPVNPDGSDFSMSGASPVAIGGGQYKWVTRIGTPEEAVVLRRGGGHFITNINGAR